jgi:predicted O-methyltransferase YrrM
MLLRLFVIASRGAVLEIGSYIGGATIVLAATAKEFRKGPVISIEPGGAHNHPVIPSADIFSDLVRNIKEAGISEHVTLLNGFSDDSKVVQSVVQASGGKKIDLLIIDADGDVGRDFSTYLKLLKIGAIIVLDDYVSWCAPEKAQPVKEWVDRTVSSGTLSPLGVWGWGYVDRNLYRVFVRDIGPKSGESVKETTPSAVHDIVPLMLNKWLQTRC